VGWIPRQYPRFKVALPIELRPEGGNAPLRAQTGDICLGGCYVEMMFTQEISTQLEIKLWIGDTKISARGVVVSSHPSFGNGIKFTYVASESRDLLSLYLDSL
jgi:hypothetical protein